MIRNKKLQRVFRTKIWTKMTVATKFSQLLQYFMLTKPKYKIPCSDSPDSGVTLLKETTSPSTSTSSLAGCTVIIGNGFPDTPSLILPL